MCSVHNTEYKQIHIQQTKPYKSSMVIRICMECTDKSASAFGAIPIRLFVARRKCIMHATHKSSRPHCVDMTSPGCNNYEEFPLGPMR